jgi:hypothetical protein
MVNTWGRQDMRIALNTMFIALNTAARVMVTAHQEHS